MTDIDTIRAYKQGRRQGVADMGEGLLALVEATRIQAKSSRFTAKQALDWLVKAYEASCKKETK